MKIKLLLTVVITVILGAITSAQSTINITTSGGSYTTEKWVSITTAVDGGGTQVWGQGNGTYGDGQGLINQDISIAPGTYWVNCYDRYSDGWDGTLISVTSLGSVIGDNGGVSPSDSSTNDTDGSWETPADELEASFQIVVIAPPSCLPPSAMTTSNIDETSADINWTVGGSETLWDIEYGITGFAQGSGSLIDDTSNKPYNLTGLTPDTTYDVYVRAHCGVGDESPWAGPVQFKTLCNVITTFPWEETVESASATLSCWTIINNNADADQWSVQTTSTYANSGSQSFQMYTDYNNGSNDDYLITPQLALTGNERLKFNYRARSSSEPQDFTVLLSTTGTAPADFTTTILPNASYSNTTYDETIVDLTTYTGNVYIAFHVPPAGLDGYYLYIDDIIVEELPTCIEPSALTAANMNISSADLSWTSGGSLESAWEIEYGALGFSQGSGTIVNANSNPYNLTGLSSGTTYDYYVRADCTGGDLSEWVGPYSFTTACSTFNIPFTENFDTTAAGSTSAPNAPNCWSFIDGGSGWTYIFNSSFNSQSGLQNYRLYNGADTTGDYMLISPEIAELTTDGIKVNFSVKGASGQELEIGTMSDPSDASTFTVLNTVSLTSSSYENIELIVVAGTDSYLALRHGQTGTYDSYYLDDFSFSELPSCIKPTNLGTANVTATTADLNWVSGGSGETSWEVEYGAVGFTQGAGTTVAPATNPVSISSLNSNTNYDFYVRASCGGAGFSEWSGPLSFMTLPGAHTYPLSEDFESGFDLFENATGNSTDFAVSTAYFHTGSQSVQNAHGTNDLNYLHETGLLDLSTATSPELRFWQIAKTEGTWDKCYIQISTDGGATYINLPAAAYSGSSTNYGTAGYFHEDSYAVWGTAYDTPDNATWWQEEVFSLDAYKVANVRIRFFLDSDGSANREGWFIDDITVDEAPPLEYIWDGTSWNNTPEGSITSINNMTIQAGTMPSLTAAISVNDLTIESGATLEADNGDITVAGSLSNNGTITGSNEVVFTGGTEFITGTGTMDNLTVAASGTVVVAGQQSIIEQVDVVSGGFLSVDTNGSLTLVSNAFGTARVDEVDTVSITGNVTVERYIPAGNRAYRFIGSTVSGPTVFDSWQEGGNNAAGFGVQVSGTAGTAGTVNATTGHDETVSGNKSMYKWDAANQAWVSVDNTKTEVLSAGDYYRLFVRGDRTTDLSNNAAAHTATTLRATGTLMLGSMTVTPAVASGEFFALANPFQSKVSMATATTNGVAADMYYWDPNLGTNGGYSAIDIAGGTGTAGTATNILDAGQAVFFADASAAASVTINEASKVSGNNNGGVFNTTPLTQALRVKLYQTARFNNGQSESDGMYVHFNASHNLNVDYNDAVKLYGLNANIAISKATGETLAVERRTLPTTAESINLNISNYLTTAYTIEATVDVLPGLTAYLKDNFTGTMTELIQGTSTAVDYTVDMNDAASLDALRFEIVFQTVTLSNDDTVFGTNLSVYPNPVTGDAITINLGNTVNEMVSVQVYNTLGQQVMTNDFDNVSNGVITLDNLSGLSNGVYIMNVSSGDATTSRRFIKK
ncbi:MAG: choice-of-anchor J domain-containing protein [Nonlabens sp.]|uniref:choice-of-anchor J domain-containing protein n=1 Tax=Nonlabens sp. TaxID=1888209 RepID=UPI003EF7F526